MASKVAVISDGKAPLCDGSPGLPARHHLQSLAHWNPQSSQAPCQHNFCLKCFQDHVNKSKKKCCPTCRTEVWGRRADRLIWSAVVCKGPQVAMPDRTPAGREVLFTLSLCKKLDFDQPLPLCGCVRGMATPSEPLETPQLWYSSQQGTTSTLTHAVQCQVLRKPSHQHRAHDGHPCLQDRHRQPLLQAL